VGLVVVEFDDKAGPRQVDLLAVDVGIDLRVPNLLSASYSIRLRTSG